MDSNGLNRKRILIVDDEPMVRMALKAVISFYLPECQVDEARNGKEGLDAFLQTRQALVLMDLQMPVMDGMTCFREISKACEGEGSPMPAILFCTAYAPSGEIRYLVDSGPSHGLLQKPMSNENLVAEIRKRLGEAVSSQPA